MKLPDLHLIGSGRLAFSLALAWQKAGGRIASVWSRNKETGQKLADLVGAECLNQPTVNRSPGWLVLAVKDAAVFEVAAQLEAQANLLVLHASGTLPLEVLNKHPHIGVMWPLQSMQFAGNDWSTIPLFLESSTLEDADQLMQIASHLSKKCYEVSGVDRQRYHLAAVLAGNFSNALYQVIYELLKQHKLDPKVVLPILQAGLTDLMEQPPANRQTGPALRKDQKVMDQHLELLAKAPDLTALYLLFSKLIQQQAESLARN